MIQWHLQQFADDKTEKATPKKRQEARKKGQVFKSNELNTALTLSMALLAFKLLAGTSLENLVSYLRTDLTSLLMLPLTEENAHALLLQGTLVVVKLLLPLIAVIMFTGLAVSYLQVGSVLSFEPLKPDFNKINPVSGMKRLFSLRSLMELVKSLLKIGLIGYIAYQSLAGQIIGLDQLLRMEPLAILSYIGGSAFSLMGKLILVLLALSVFDYAYQWYEYEKGLRMSKQEIKDEFKNTEGDPLIRSRIKERQRAMAMSRMMQEVPKADVVITNPTHYAVALRYDGKTMQAPVVLAKGIDELAQRIKRVAREHDIVLVENRPLAQALYKSTDIGQAIPPELYQAVAEVIAYVYRLKRKV